MNGIFISFYFHLLIVADYANFKSVMKFLSANWYCRYYSTIASGIGFVGGETSTIYAVATGGVRSALSVIRVSRLWISSEILIHFDHLIYSESKSQSYQLFIKIVCMII